LKNRLLMDCGTLLNAVYDSDSDNPPTLINRTRMKLHLLFCPSCRLEAGRLSQLENFMKTEFFRPSPAFDEIIMERLYEEAMKEEKTDAPAGFSFKSWVIIGFFVLLSLASSVFGMNFIQIASKEGLSFLLPVGITIGMFVSCYGAFFIGSHLNELSDRFGLR